MNNYQELTKKQLSFFNSGKTKDVAFRIETLKKLRELVVRHEDDILKAVKADLNKPEIEAKRAEVGLVLSEIDFAVKNLAEWAAPKEVETPSTHAGAKSYIYQDPYGLALVIAPWNYPFQLAVSPVVGAIAAGNCVVLKPSELTPHTSSLLAKMFNENFPEEYLTVVEGEVETSTALLKENFDYIFFTGSTMVGKIVAEAAAKHLTPVTLELGGKSPTIVHEDANIEEAAKRIARGKFANAGQTCVAPDYILVQRNVKDELLANLKQVVTNTYGEDVSQNLDFPHVVSEKHFDRLNSFLTNGDIVFGGKTDRSRLFIEPTVLDNISWEDNVMQDEIFGPILPVIVYDEISEVIEAIVKRPKPLALYLFSEDEAVQDRILNSVSFGGGSINDTINHMTSHYLPFGGVGDSGMGAYHGKASFDTFSHAKSILKRSNK
ncbi:aldehyde dehydrogenase [Priestia megaterium]|jgi:aldehyde dehydrogenase (NAD+)|uniref:Aldehyde dehydrogenase n=2 Tax=Priestia TaxID=2800373 RepID=D5DZJ4_PRIM1|nr:MULTISPECIES: aldehyde dehydrogenase [Priestia]AVX09340.1 aldehyde dehydrogenase [Bacillus sp. Y-01]KOP75474.1 aldehyde dehydrogenase [Bacillus sp. FJAT-21351]MBZ5481519.1 aldehyde dehydrogenase [Bacillus sp. T_4]MCJ7985407.1 aldehyde dehydrogenase [Priestia sp. OVL9]MDH6653629.1 aldehyde dehydrogenase (NAD+) [Bacillus sp. PvP124]